MPELPRQSCMSPSRPLNARERGLGVAQGIVVALLVEAGVWAVLAFVLWVVV